MTPPELLILTTGLTLGAAGGELLLAYLHRKRLADVARQWGMNYSPTDSFRLTPKVARHFPVPGAAKLRIGDLIYGQVGNEFRCIFTCEFTVGVVSGKFRVVRVASLVEPRDRGEAPSQPITLAPPHQKLLAQYNALRSK